MSKLIIGGREFSSRLFVGTGKFRSNEIMEQAILASGTQMVTVAMKRIDMDNTGDEMLHHIPTKAFSCYPTHQVCATPARRCSQRSSPARRLAPTS